MKSFVRFFLSLCFLLFIGSGHLNAHRYQDRFHHASISRNKGSAKIDLCTFRSDDAHLARPGKQGRGRKHAPPGNAASESREEEEQEEDDEDKQLAAHKFTKAANYFILSFCAAAPLPSNNSFKDLPSTGKHYSYSSEYRHIFLRVIRI